MKEKMISAADFLKEKSGYILAILALRIPALLVLRLDLLSVFGWRKGLMGLFWNSAFTVLWIYVFMIISFVVLPKRIGKIFYGIVSTVFIIFSFCQYVYSKMFDKFFWIKSIMLADEGADYFGTALSYIDAKAIIFTLVSIICLVFALKNWGEESRYSKRWRAVALIFPVIGIVLLRTILLSDYFCESRREHFSWLEPGIIYENFDDVNKSYYVSGYHHTALRDLYHTVFERKTDERNLADFEAVEKYFEEKASVQNKENTYTGLFKDKNLIVIMMEGIDTWMVNEKYTPTICYMMENGINFTNYHAPTFGTGPTFNSEFAFNTGFFNPISSVSAVDFNGNTYPFTAARLFEEAGYAVNSWHFNDPEFYNRNTMHEMFGFEKYNSFSDLYTTEPEVSADSNVLKNENIYEQMVKNKPFFNFIITYSAHVPYMSEDVKKNVAKKNHPELIDADMDVETNNILVLAADTDDFFKQLLEKLEKDGIMEDTIIMAYTDHYTYMFSDQEKLKNEYKKDEIIYHVPAFIYSKDIESAKITKPAMTIDLLPTLINLFDLSREGKYLGNDIFAPENTGFVCFEDNSWLDDKMYYTPSGENSEEEDTEHIQKQSAKAAELLKINDIMVSGDYFKEAK